ncbi:MAG TPA: hypothetical protein VMU05_01105 [Dongiaceae bacterium]|nr:hypothetical protein [Dongiaceae bacterium]
MHPRTYILAKYFAQFDAAARQQLIELKQTLSSERGEALAANNAMQLAVIEELSDRVATLLERMDQRKVK